MWPSFAIDRGFAGDLRVPGTDGYVPVDMFRSMALGFQVRQGCRYEARLSADTQPALNKMTRWRESGKYRVYESIGKAHAGIYEIDGAGRETKVAGGDANLSAK